MHLGVPVEKTHHARQTVSNHLHHKHGLDNVADLLHDLNEARKSESYGDIEPPELDAEETVARIEAYVLAVEDLVARQAHDSEET